MPRPDLDRVRATVSAHQSGRRSAAWVRESCLRLLVRAAILLPNLPVLARWRGSRIGTTLVRARMFIRRRHGLVLIPNFL